MDIPGEDLPGSWPATAFVAWYNGHPDFQELPFDLSAERAVVVGNGNVAVDVARMLALTADEIEPTDTTDEAIAAILGSGIREILVLGRRGPAQAAFTTPGAAGADRARGRRPRRRSGRSRARPGERGRARGRHRDRAPQRRAAARGGGQAADGQAEDASSSASASHRSRSSATARSRPSRSSATSSSPTRLGTSAPCRRRSAR